MTNRILIVLILLAACSPNVETRGHLMDADWKEQIHEGSSREDVTKTLGSPSSISSFGDETWYYITARRESFAFFKPEVAEKKTVAVTFDSGGAVSSIEELDGTQSKQFATISRTTPTEGHQMTFMEQLLGNIGRFNTPKDSTPGSVSNRRGPGR